MIRSYLAVNLDSVHVRLSAPTTADIWVVINGMPFPVEGWNDFAVVILRSWAEAVLRLMRKAADRETVYFMEGAYAVEVIRTPGGTLRFRGLEGIDRNRERTSGDAPVGQFARSLCSIGRTVLDACRDLGAWTSDEQSLEALIESLEREIEVAKS